MYRVLFFCRNNPAAGWQGKGTRDSLNSARLLAIMLQTGTRGKAIVLDASGKIVFSVG
jgi:DNA repair protein RadC